MDMNESALVDRWPRLATHVHWPRVGLDTLVAFIILAPLSLLLLFEAIVSLRWRMVHDSPLSHYIAYLVNERGFALYRDLFETSFPGTFIFHMAIGRAFGYSDGAFMAISLVWLALVSVATWKIMRGFGRRPAAASNILFALAYLAGGPAMMLQRDFILLLPLALAINIATFRGIGPVARAALIGGLFGIAVTFKPHAILGLPALLIFDWAVSHADGAPPRPTRRDVLTLGSSVTAGLALPPLAVTAWLASTGSLSAFIEMVRNYLPLYLTLDGAHRNVVGFERVKSLIAGEIAFGGNGLWFIAACLGTYITLTRCDLPARLQYTVRLLLALTVLYGFYPITAGQFFDYHWMPFLYFVIMLSSLCLCRVSRVASRSVQILPALVLLLTIALVLRPAPALIQQLQGRPTPAPKNGRVDALATFLQTHARPGDTVQPLDWTGGSVQAMLLARVNPATPYIYDYLFYHHVSQPYIRLERARFIAALEQSSPRFVVDVQAEDKPWVSGPDTTREFPELKRFLATNYMLVVTSEDYVIYERR